MTNIKPVFITGAPRSGTTLLASMISSGKNAIALPEMHYIHKILRYELLFMNTNNDKYIMNVLLNDPKFVELGLVENTPELENIVRGKCATDIIIKIIDLYNHRNCNKQYSHWIEHSPHNHKYFDMLLHYFPEAKFVHIVRDGRAVYRSTKETDWGYKDVVTGAKDWNNIVEHNVTLTKCYPDKIINVRYEDLIASPEIEIKKICSFVGLSYSDELLSTTGVRKQSFSKYHKHIGSAVNKSSADLWRKELGKTEIDYFNFINKELLVLFGYHLNELNKNKYNNIFKIYHKLIGYLKTYYYSRKAKKRFQSVYELYPKIKQDMK